MLSSVNRTMRRADSNSQARHRWSRTLARALAPRRFLRVLPTRTRPSLFGSD